MVEASDYKFCYLCTAFVPLVGLSTVILNDYVKRSTLIFDCQS